MDLEVVAMKSNAFLHLFMGNSNMPESCIIGIKNKVLKISKGGKDENRVPFSKQKLSTQHPYIRNAKCVIKVQKNSVP